MKNWLDNFEPVTISKDNSLIGCCYDSNRKERNIIYVCYLINKKNAGGIYKQSNKHQKLYFIKLSA